MDVLKNTLVDLVLFQANSWVALYEAQLYLVSEKLPDILHPVPSEHLRNRLR